MNFLRKLFIIALTFSTVTCSQLVGMKRACDWVLERVCKRQRTEPVAQPEQQLIALPLQVPDELIELGEQAEQQLIPFMPQSDLQVHLNREASQYILAILSDLVNLTQPEEILELIHHARVTFRLNVEATVNVIRVILAKKNITLLEVYNAERKTIFHLACESNDIDSIYIICCLAIGDYFLASFSSYDQHDTTAFYTAVRRNYNSIVKSILFVAENISEWNLPQQFLSMSEGGYSSQAKIAATPLIEAARFGSTDVAITLLQWLRSLNNFSNLTRRNVDGDTVLHKAACNGGDAIVESILKFDGSWADARMLVFMSNNKGETPLHVAVQNGHLHIVKMIVAVVGKEAYSLILIPDFKGKTARDYALDAYGYKGEISIFLREQLHPYYPNICSSYPNTYVGKRLDCWPDQ